MTEATIIDKVLEIWDEDDESLKVMEKGEWISEGKYDNKETVVEYEGKYYSICETRSGSYFSDYEHGDTYCYEVKPVQVTVTKWVVVK